MKRILCLVLLAVMLTACGQTPQTTEQTQPVAVDTVQEALVQTEDTTVYERVLTEEEAASYESGSFVLVEHLGGDRYRFFFQSNGVEKDGNKLIARFNGKVPYVCNDRGVCYLPMARELETQDGKSCYELNAVFSMVESDVFGDTVQTMEYYNIYTVFDRATGQLTDTKFLSSGETPEQLFGDNQPMPEYTVPAEYSFSGGTDYYIPKDETGALLPMDQWRSEHSFYMDWKGSEGLQLAYGRLAQITRPYVTNDVYMLILAKDENGNSTSSPLLPVQLQDAVAVKETPQEARQLQWETGNKLMLLQEEDIALYLNKTSYGGIISYDFQLKNDTWQDLEVNISDVVVNDRIVLEDMAFRIEAGKWGKSAYPLRFSAASIADGLDRVEKLRFTIFLTSGYDNVPLKEETLCVTMTGNASLKAYCYGDLGVAGDQTQQIAYGFHMTQPQLLGEQKGVQVTVLGVGCEQGKTGLNCLLKVENTTAQWRHTSLKGILINGVYVACKYPLELPGETTVYLDCAISEEDLLPIQQISSLAVGFCAVEGKLQTGYSLPDTVWYPITGQSAAEAPTELPEGQLLLEEQGLRITMLEQTTDYADRPVWKVLVENTTDRTMLLKPAEELLNGLTPEYNKITLYNNIVPAGQRAILEVRADGSEDVSFLLEVQNEQGSSILFTTEGRVQLKAQ